MFNETLIIRIIIKYCILISRSKLSTIYNSVWFLMNIELFSLFLNIFMQGLHIICLRNNYFVIIRVKVVKPAVAFDEIINLL